MNVSPIYREDVVIISYSLLSTGSPGLGGGGGLHAEVWRRSGEERAFTPVLNPEGEPGPTHMAEPL